MPRWRKFNVVQLLWPLCDKQRLFVMLQSEEEKDTNSQTSAVDVQPPIATHSHAVKLKSSHDTATQTSWSDDGLFKIPQVCSH
jgi:hypothetical protein